VPQMRDSGLCSYNGGSQHRTYVRFAFSCRKNGLELIQSAPPLSATHMKRPPFGAAFVLARRKRIPCRATPWVASVTGAQPPMGWLYPAGLPAGDAAPPPVTAACSSTPCRDGPCAGTTRAREMPRRRRCHPRSPRRDTGSSARPAPVAEYQSGS